MASIIKNIFYGITIFSFLALAIKALIFINGINYSDPQQNINGLASFTAEAVTSWWIPVMQKVVGWGILGVVIIAVIVYFLRKYPEAQ